MTPPRKLFQPLKVDINWFYKFYETLTSLRYFRANKAKEVKRLWQKAKRKQQHPKRKIQEKAKRKAFLSV